MTTAYSAGRRMASLDLLRLFSALAVVVFHFGFRGSAGASPYLSTGYPEIAGFAVYGYLGVNLFFLISGFVIAWSAENRGFVAFAIARFARLYPGYVTCMTATALAIAFFGMAPLSVNLPQYAANLTMLAPALGHPFMDGVYWTIVLEIVFYGWVSLALLAGVFERWKLPLMAAWLALAMLNEFAIGSGALRLLFVTQYAPFFIGGVLLHHAVSRGISLETTMLAVAAFLFSMTSTGTMREWMLDAYGTAPSLPSLMAANGVVHLLVIVAIVFGHHLRAHPWMAAAGALTYPLYLLHQHVGYIALNRLTSAIGRWEAFALAIAGLVAFSWLIARFVERPARRAIVRGFGAAAELLALLRTRRIPES